MALFLVVAGIFDFLVDILEVGSESAYNVLPLSYVVCTCPIGGYRVVKGFSYGG